LQWEIKDDGKLALYLLAVGVLFIYYPHLYVKRIFQDDIVDENMNPKSSMGSITISHLDLDQQLLHCCTI